MQELEQKISKLLQEEQPITESEAQDLATLICSLPEINGGRVEAEVKPANDVMKIIDEMLDLYQDYYRARQALIELRNRLSV